MKFNLPAGALVPLAVAPKAKSSNELSAAFSAKDTWSGITSDLAKAALAKLVQKQKADIAASKTAGSGLRKIDIAIALLIEHPELSNKRK